METFVDFANIASGKRLACQNAYHANLEKIQQVKQTKLNELKTTIECESMSYDDLRKMTPQLEKEFAEMGNEDVWGNDYWSDMDGIPGAITIPVEEVLSKIFVEANDEKYGHKKCYNDLFASRRPKDSTAIENYKNAYNLCLTILQDHDIIITEIMRDPTKFKNFGRSTCCEDSTSLSFKCTKGNYTFTVEYDDDCDSYPGMFMVTDLKQISPEMNLKKNGNCDLISYDADKVTTEQKDFYCLLDSPDYDSYVESRFGHFLRLPEYLREEGYTVTHSDELIPKGSIRINDHARPYTYVLTVSYDNVAFDIVANPEYGDNGDYWLYINPTLEEQNRIGKQTKSYHYERTEYEWNTFHHFDKNEMHRVRAVYNSDDDFDNLLDMIDIYHDWNSGEYGFLENDQYYNETHIPKLPNMHFEGATSMSDMFYDYEFSVYARLRPRHSMSAYCRKHIKGMECPQDFYGLTFKYDSTEDHCVLTIEGVWYDMTSISDKYYNGDKDFNKFMVHTIAPMYVFKGKYSECIEKIVEFSTKMTEIENNYKDE